MAGRTSSTFEADAHGQTGQRVVAIQHHMAVVHLGHGVDGVRVQVGGLRALGRAVELHAFDHFGRENLARFEEDQIGVIVAKSVLGLQMQIGFEAHALAQQGLFDLGQEVFSAQQNSIGSLSSSTNWPWASSRRHTRLTTQGEEMIMPRSSHEATASVGWGLRSDARRGRFSLSGISTTACSWRHNATMKSTKTSASAAATQATPAGPLPIDHITPLLGGMSPETFMRRYWQKKPLLIRQAMPGVRPPIERSKLFALAGAGGRIPPDRA